VGKKAGSCGRSCAFIVPLIRGVRSRRRSAVLCRRDRTLGEVTLGLRLGPSLAVDDPSVDDPQAQSHGVLCAVELTGSWVHIECSACQPAWFLLTRSARIY